MQTALPYLVVLAIIGVVFVWPAWRSFKREEAEARAELEEARRTGRTEPATMLPWIDVAKCCASGLCVKACPEGVLRVVDGRAQVTNGAACVGHGACEAACPTKAIELVFGSERRGVDLPRVGPDFQTNVPGIYVAGELGGMGLISNAVRQGTQAAEAALRGVRARTHADEATLDLVIVGAGPAGIAAALRARQLGCSVVACEQGEFGGAIRHYPRKKLVMSHGFTLPGGPRVEPGKMSKEALIEVLAEALAGSDVQVREGVRVDGVAGDRGAFTVKTSDGVVRARRVLLAAGRRGTPRRLGVPGEERDKVAYRLLEPEACAFEAVLVVGGGDSAVEAACALAEQEGTKVVLSYRKGTLTRPKRENQARIAALAAAGALDLMLGSAVREIGPDRVRLHGPDGEVVLPNDRVFVFAGGILPTALLTDAGIRLERHFGKRVEALEPASA